MSSTVVAQVTCTDCLNRLPKFLGSPALPQPEKGPSMPPEEKRHILSQKMDMITAGKRGGVRAERLIDLCKHHKIPMEVPTSGHGMRFIREDDLWDAVSKLNAGEDGYKRAVQKGTIGNCGVCKTFRGLKPVPWSERGDGFCRFGSINISSVCQDCARMTKVEAEAKMRSVAANGASTVPKGAVIYTKDVTPPCAPDACGNACENQTLGPEVFILPETPGVRAFATIETHKHPSDLWNIHQIVCDLGRTFERVLKEAAKKVEPLAVPVAAAPLDNKKLDELLLKVNRVSTRLEELDEKLNTLDASFQSNLGRLMSSATQTQVTGLSRRLEEVEGLVQKTAVELGVKV